MATVNQLKSQIAGNIRFAGGVAIPPPPPIVNTGEHPLVLFQGAVADGTDYGDIKVEDGKLVLDLDHFSPDYGTF